MRTFSERIKAARQKFGLTKRGAALRWGFAVSTLQAWESEVRHPAGLYREKLETILKNIECA